MGPVSSVHNANKYVCLLTVLAVGASTTNATVAFDVVQYSTNFSSAPENPISEGGRWHHVATPWGTIKTVTNPNRAVGTQTGYDGYNDSFAYLSGFPPDVMAYGTIYKDPTIVNDPLGSHEIEILFRVVDTPTTVRAYECNLAFDGSYSEMGRWNGPFNKFSAISEKGPTHGTSFPPGTMPPVTGDIFKATIQGNIIKVYINKNDGKGDQLINSGVDYAFPDGQPGIGMWLKNGPQVYDGNKFGFSSFTVTTDIAIK
jgi:hypothetical protein